MQAEVWSHMSTSQGARHTGPTTHWPRRTLALPHTGCAAAGRRGVSRRFSVCDFSHWKLSSHQHPASPAVRALHSVDSPRPTPNMGEWLGEAGDTAPRVGACQRDAADSVGHHPANREGHPGLWGHSPSEIPTARGQGSQTPPGPAFPVPHPNPPAPWLAPCIAREGGRSGHWQTARGHTQKASRGLQDGEKAHRLERFVHRTGENGMNGRLSTPGLAFWGGEMAYQRTDPHLPRRDRDMWRGRTRRERLRRPQNPQLD